MISILIYRNIIYVVENWKCFWHMDIIENLKEKNVRKMSHFMGSRSDDGS